MTCLRSLIPISLLAVASLCACTPQTTSVSAPSASAVSESASPDPGRVEATDGPRSFVPTDDADSQWFRAQAGVADARSETDTTTGERWISVDLDPGIRDQDLIALTGEAQSRLTDALDPDGDTIVFYSVGPGRELSSVGGRSTVDAFIAYRAMSDLKDVSLFGRGSEGRGITMTLASEESTLSDVLTEHLLVADDLRSQGVDSQTTLWILSSDGHLSSHQTLDTDLHGAADFAMNLPAVTLLQGHFDAGRFRLGVSSEDDAATLRAYSTERGFDSDVDVFTG